MSLNLPHLILKNTTRVANKFDRSRAIEQESVRKNPEEYKAHKERLGSSFKILKIELAHRRSHRTILLDAIEVVEIRFFIPFSDGARFNTRTRFLRDFGLSPVFFKDFNRTVLFAIVDAKKFATFDTLLNQYISSDDSVAPHDQKYAIMTILFDVRYHTAKQIQNYCNEDLVFELIKNNEHLDSKYKSQRTELEDLLNIRVLSGDIESFEFGAYDNLLQLKGVNKEQLLELVNNFDILVQAHSVRSSKIGPDRYNQQKLTWDLKISSSAHTTTVVGILDNGVRRIEPIQEIVIGGYSIKDDKPLNPSNPHGTVVASLAAVGESFFSGKEELVADADIFSIKIIDDFEGYIDVFKVVEAIRNAHHQNNIKLFNLSVCGFGKLYNEAPSFYAYLLDKLTYEEDILIFIAVGNLGSNDIHEMQSNPHNLHYYPNHFYNPDELTHYHTCENSNLCVPAESMNNISVGALADNFRPETESGLSPDKKHPAYYTRKNHYDFKQKPNGGTFSQNHLNVNLFKPDIVMPGGDSFNDESRMQVLGFGEFGDDFYSFDSGTSLASPLAVNLAVQLLNLYPNLALLSVKALLLNSAKSIPETYLESGFNKRRDAMAFKLFGESFNELDSNQRRDVNKKILGVKDINRALVGLGMPNRDKLLYSSESDVSFLIEDLIENDCHKVIILNIPQYLLNSSVTTCLSIDATLCFKVNPAWGNHTDYNPLHISFNFINGIISSEDELAEIISNRSHPYFQNFWDDEITKLEQKKVSGNISRTDNKRLSELKLKLRNKLLGVKASIPKWSEDFFPLVNKPLSNRQQMKINITKNEIKKIGNKLAIVFRCAVKDNLDFDLEEWKSVTPEHQFSLAVRIKDQSPENTESAGLYSELQQVNTMEVVQNNIVGLEGIVDAQI
ncbi:S8 family serine peptidase [Chryseobacterium sp. A321]